MKRAAVSILFQIALLFGMNIAVHAAVAMGERDNPADEEAVTQNQNAAHSAIPNSKKLGTIQVGPSASGEAVRILSTAYTLRPLTPHWCRTCLGVIVGRADLFNPSIAVQLRAAYEAGHGIALTNATPAGIEQLHDLLEHRGSAHPPSSVASADLVGFRKAFRADGQLHSSSHVLLPRTPPSGTFSKRDRNKRQRVADANDIKALQRIFSATAIVPGKPPGDDPQNLVSLAESYESHGVQSDSNGDQVQLINTVWAARSFLNSSDFYYVNQEVDYQLFDPIGSTVTSWSNGADASILPLSNVTLLQPSPQTTMEATQLMSGVSNSLGVSVGYNASQGPDVSVTKTTTISNSNSTTVPAMNITNNADFSDGATDWSYVVNDLSNPGAIDLYNNWIWQVPFSSYAGTTQGQVAMGSDASLDATFSNAGPAAVSVSLESFVPWPFGEVFQIQPPVVTGVSPGCVNSGDSFTIQGTGLYPSLVQAVLINGSPVASQGITTVSATQVNVIAPDTIQCHFGCPVAVQTNEGTSNTNVNIEISSFCGG